MHRSARRRKIVCQRCTLGVLGLPISARRPSYRIARSAPQRPHSSSLAREATSATVAPITSPERFSPLGPFGKITLHNFNQLRYPG